MKKYIVILSNEPKFSKKYGNNKKVIKLIDNAFKFVRIRFCNHNNFGKRKDVLVLHNLNSLLNYNNVNYFDKIKEFNEVLISPSILLSNN
tara:strand:- start:788 stop:1057 length:270 start_codon:yes stop_codon:yes gene_type:complete